MIVLLSTTKELLSELQLANDITQVLQDEDTHVSRNRILSYQIQLHSITSLTVLTVVRTPFYK